MALTWENTPVPAELAEPLRRLLDRLYARLRARGGDADACREQAAEMAADLLACPIEQARAVALQTIARRPPVP